MSLAQTEHLVQPNMADPLCGEPNNFHFIYTNSNVAQKDRLFLFFPGTGSIPFNYREILKHAANIGFHSIGLTYPNSEAINDICLTSVDTTCHSRARLEIFDGIDRHADVNVDENNCIEKRTLKLLTYLSNTYPNENWGQYLNGNEIQWEKIIVSGFSQGGGHAGIISKIKQVERVVMFAAMDWIPLLNRNADWISWSGPTSESRYYGFTHQNDEKIDFNKIQITWDNYGMNNFGSLVLVDTTYIPYGNSHQLYTLLPPANDPEKFHNAVVVDVNTPFNNNQPIYAPVWTYMIEGNEVLTSMQEQLTPPSTSAYPNPTSATLTINCEECYNLDFTIYSSRSQLVQTGKLQSATIDVSNLESGVYFLHFNKYNNLDIIKFFIE
jgi:hypothetical protein